MTCPGGAIARGEEQDAVLLPDPTLDEAGRPIPTLADDRDGRDRGDEHGPTGSGAAEDAGDAADEGTARSPEAASEGAQGDRVVGARPHREPRPNGPRPPRRHVPTVSAQGAC